MKKMLILVCGLLCIPALIRAQKEPMIQINGQDIIPVRMVDEILIEEEDILTSDVLLFLESYPEYSLFKLAVEATQIERRLSALFEDPEYVRDETDYSEYRLHDLHIEVPGRRLFYYTCFIEPNSVYEESIPGIKEAKTDAERLKLLQEYALAWFCDAYEGTSEATAARNGTYPVTDARNYFNKFVAYHFVDKKIDRTDFTRYGIGMEPGYARYKEYAETLAPGQMLYMSAGKNGNSFGDNEHVGLLQLNPSPENEVLFFEGKDWTRPSRDGVFLSEVTLEHTHSFFHELRGILTYPRKDFMKMRFRMDLSSLFPEVMSNDFRYKYNERGRIVFPDGYLSNLKVLSPGSVFLMISPNRSATGGYNGYQGDEFFMYNTYDFILRLPPVPAGQYEVRLGMSCAGARGCAQFYLGTSEENLKACGLPVDMTLTADRYGWKDDGGTEEDYSVDMIMRAKGWMKGPDSWRCCNGNSARSLRATENSSGTGHSPMRHIIGTVNLQEDGSIYLRARNATTSTKVELMMDYIEICPVSVYDNPNKPEPRD